MTDLVNRIVAKIFYHKVGIDQFGNEYLISRFNDAYGKKRRIVIYKGIAEPTKVPAAWHSWLHHTSNEIPDNTKRYDWLKQHLPNRSGTSKAYAPPDIEARAEPSRGLYKAWHPKS
jgi:NADH:ubiquinone oxidoreductase subunit